MKVAKTFSKCFADTLVLGMDPNVLFIGSKTPIDLPAPSLLHRVSDKYFYTASFSMEMLSSQVKD